MPPIISSPTSPALCPPESGLPDVKPLSCNTNLTFTEWQRIVSDLMARDRTLEAAFLDLTRSLDLQALGAILNATQVILGPELVTQVAGSGAMPDNLENFEVFQRETNDRLGTIESSVTFTDLEGTPRSIKALALNNQANIQSLNQKVDEFDQELEDIKEITDDIDAIKEFVDNVEARLKDVEELSSDTAAEVKNARKEFADQPGKRLIDKIDAMDSERQSMLTKLNAAIKELTDARSPDRFDTLAERMGDLESQLEDINEQINLLQGQGTVTGIKVGRSVLTGQVEIIPGSNFAIVRERNGYRMNVVDFGTCVDYAAPKIDPNNGCCGPNNPNFGN